jgi:histone-lysine N-methyltransferase SETMAR
MSKKFDQRICVKFCVSNRITASKTLEMMQIAFRDNTLSRTQVFDWHKSFKEGSVNVEDEPQSGKPSTATDDNHVTKAKELVLENRRLSVKELASALGISAMSAHAILTEHLGMKRIEARLVPRTLNFLQKERRKDVAEEMIFNARNDSIFL